MKLESVNDFLNTSGIHTFYPLMFPSTDAKCSTVDLTGGTFKRGGVQKIFMRIVTRESHPQLAINKALEIQGFLTTDFKGAFFDGLEVLNIESDNPSPLFLGDENGLYTVSMNYTILEG